MSKSPKRLFRAEHIADGVRTVAELQQQVLKEKPTSAGPLTALAPPPAGEEPPEVLAGHCLTCKTKRAFTVDKTETMKNGALRKSGTSTEAGCGHNVSHFVSGKADAA